MNSVKKLKNKETKKDGTSETPLGTQGGDASSASPTSLGDEMPISLIIKNCRLEKRLSLQDVSKELHIREVYLVALEENNLDALPERAYTLGFLRSYATFLGLDGVWAMKKYKQEMDTREGGVEDSVADQVVSQSLLSVQSTKWISLILFILFLGALWWITQQQKEDPAEPAPSFPQEIFREHAPAAPLPSLPSLQVTPQ